MPGAKGEMRTWVDAEPCVVLRDDNIVQVSIGKLPTIGKKNAPFT